MAARGRRRGSIRLYFFQFQLFGNAVAERSADLRFTVSGVNCYAGNRFRQLPVAGDGEKLQYKKKCCSPAVFEHDQ